MFNFDINILIWALLIFAALLLQVLVGTVRTLMMVKGKKVLTSIVGFFEGAIAITVAITVVSNAVKSGINVYMILFYALGFATGLYFGVFISSKISRDMLSVNIVTKSFDVTLEDALRDHGFGVTCYNGSGKDGDIRILNIICKKTNLKNLKLLVYKIDPNAMVTVHTLEGLSGGFIFDLKSRI